MAPLCQWRPGGTKAVPPRHKGVFKHVWRTLGNLDTIVTGLPYRDNSVTELPYRDNSVTELQCAGCTDFKLGMICFRLVHMYQITK
jgi:hypothetical protein